ncbi:unnamed protein product [Orchesella dallaii]|uniref:Elongation of very long chain fatty acids protein n=1 Tax=Orchesella dallaii TaxID=48710 RepID=A0ABP1QCG3_9HEXA
MKEPTIRTMNHTNLYEGAKDWVYVQPPKHYPFFFENVNMVWWQNMMIEYWKFPFVICAIYLSIVFGIQAFMKNREAYKLRRVLIIWNLTMAAINLMGFLRQAPELYEILNKPDGIHRSLCVREELNQPAATWGLYFCLSKFIFLGDTVLIVLTKRPLLFIYWYHHVVAVLISWQIFPDSEPICRWIGSSNFFVLAVMYFYFALKAMNFKLPRTAGLTIAILHVIEMFIGTATQIYTAREIVKGRECARTVNSIKWSMIPHISLLFFFGKLLFNYVRSKPKRKEA